MLPCKRARSPSSSSSSSSAAESAPLVQLDGGVPMPPKTVSLWKDGRLTDITVKVEGSCFSAHKLVLASGAEYFERLFDSTMSDANNPTLAEFPASIFEPLLEFLYQGSCSVEEGLLTSLLRAANYLGVKPLELSICAALQIRIMPSNAFDLWAMAEQLTMTLLEEATKRFALERFEELGDTVG